MPKRTEARLSPISNVEGNVRISTLGTKAAPGSKLVSYKISWGDGIASSGVNPPRELSHDYLKNGNYTIILNVKDSKNRIAEDTMGMIVQINSGTPTPPPTGIVAPDGNLATIQDIHDNQANDGDTIIVPNGSWTWSSNLVWTKALTIVGSGSTSINNNNVGGLGRLFSIALTPGQNTKLSTISFPATTNGQGQGVINVSGASDVDGSRLILDNLNVDDWGALGTVGYFCWLSGVLGVASNCTFNFDDNAHVPFEVQHPNWGGSSFGDGSWAALPELGGEEKFFFEDCIFNCDATTFPAIGGVAVDSLNGDRWVIRYCQLINCQAGNHGTESGGRQRGGRLIEAYNNACSGVFPGGIPFHFRSGTGVIFNNTFASVFYPTVTFYMECKRLSASFNPWGSADGTNPWDVNFGGGPFETGTVSSGAAGSLTDSSKSWTVNQWAGYTLKLTSGTCSSTAETCATIIESNTANTLTLRVEGFPPGPITPAAGNSYQIWKVNEALDQPGRGLGSLLSGDPPSPPVGWNDQVDEPIYAWNNTGDGSVALITLTPPSFYANQIRSGEHYFDNTIKPGYSPYTYPHPLTL